MGNPKALPSLRKINSAVASKMNPMPAKNVSVMSRINEPEYLQQKSSPSYLYPNSYFFSKKIRSCWIYLLIIDFGINLCGYALVIIQSYATLI